MAHERRRRSSEVPPSRRTREKTDRRTQEATARRPRKKSDRRSGRLSNFTATYLVLVIGISVLLASLGWISANDVLALNKKPLTATVTVSQDMIRDNGSAKMGKVASLLKDEGLIQFKSTFLLFSAITGGEDKVISGTFTLNTDMDYRALIAGMSWNSSSKAKIKVTIPEGYSCAQIFQLLEEKGVSTVEELEDIAANHDYAFSFLEDLPLGDPNRLEGYLFPDTYEFTTPHNPLYVLNKMLLRFDEQFTEDMRQQVKRSGKDIHEILTIASLIERETDGTDRGTIASVIYNRLNHPHSSTVGFLQIDATLAYINGGKVPTEADKSIDSPYNTYKHKGLPPGPIASPGMDAIQAAMHPDSTNYYYYALGDDKVHHFFADYDSMKAFTAHQKLYK